MISREACAAEAAALRAVPGVRRVLFSRPDGAAHYDDATLADRELGAASVAVLVGATDHAAQSFGLGRAEGVIVYGSGVQLIARPVNDLLMVVVADLEAAGHDVYRRVRAAGRRLDAFA